MKPKLITLLVASSFLSGCTSTMLSNEKIISNTSSVLGIPQENLSIVDRRSEATTTYYTVKTKNGTEYACTLTGGGILAAGLVNPPTCKRR